MKILRFTSGDTYTPFAPYWDYFICEDSIDGSLAGLQNEIMWQEKKIISATEFEDDWGTQLGPNSLTSRSNTYNLLTWTDAVPIKEGVKKTHDKFREQLGLPPIEIYAQCWANVMRKGEKIEPHRHGNDPYTYLSGHVCIKVDGTKTYYNKPYGGEPYGSENEVGKLTLFPSCIEHYTDRYEGDEQRVTIAFDILTQQGYDNVKEEWKGHWIKL